MDIMRAIPDEDERFIRTCRSLPLPYVPSQLRDLRRVLLLLGGRVLVSEIDHIVVYPSPRFVPVGLMARGRIKARCQIFLGKRGNWQPLKRPIRGFQGIRYGRWTANGTWREWLAGLPTRR